MSIRVVQPEMMDSMQSDSPGAERASGVQVISRAAEILRTLRWSETGISQAELAERLGLAKSTVHRLLSALEDEGLVEPTGIRGRYRVGMVVRRMAETARQGLLTQLHPLLEELSRETFETTDLSVCERNQATFVDQVVAPHRLRVVNVIGESLPLHCTAAGKAFLAALPEDARALTLKRDLDRYTARTLTDPARLEAELERIRAEEVAYDIEEHTEGLCATATLLRGRLGGLFAVGIPVPAQRFHGHQDRFRTALLGWRDRVEEQLSRAD